MRLYVYPPDLGLEQLRHQRTAGDAEVISESVEDPRPFFSAKGEKVADDADQLRAWDDHVAGSIRIGCFSATEAEDRLPAYRAPRTGDLRVTVQSYRGIEFVGAPRLIDVA